MSDAHLGATRLDDLAARAGEAFRGVQERVFAGDPAVNPRVDVEAVEGFLLDGVPTLVLITPWALNGLLFPAGPGPVELIVQGERRRAHRGDVVPLGVYWAVTLVSDVSGLASSRQARTLARAWAAPFRQGVRQWLRMPKGSSTSSAGPTS